MKEFLKTNTGLLVWIGGLIGGLTVFIASLIVIAQFLISPINTRLDHIENQVNNHIPTQIRELKTDIKALNQKIDQTNQRIDKLAEQTNQKFDQTNQRFDQTNQRLDKIFELLSSKD